MFFVLFACLGCHNTLAALEEGEELPGGATTNTLLFGSNAFLRPAETLTSDEERAFFGGNSFFNDNWVQAPASTQNRDGLGPYFNARSCSGCHFRDGRAAPPETTNGTYTGPFTGLLFRVSLPSGQADPLYGHQLQDRAILGLEPEVTASLDVTTRTVPVEGGSVTLSVPTYRFETHLGPFGENLQVSPRIAPHMAGLGLLEAIPEARLVELSDPDDVDGDGISGRLQWRTDALTGERAVGRFGWKGDAPSIPHQVAAAFQGDIGITSSVFDTDCEDLQVECLAQPSGGQPELLDRLFDRVVLYSRAVAIPARQGFDTPDVRRGKRLFNDLGCESCHVASHTTGAFEPIPSFGEQTIWPYTDLLLHDLGPDLADGRPLGEASGQEWRTPPLWGLGRVPDVNGHLRLLHDGRADGVEEAILWHGGEALDSRDAYAALAEEERLWLVAFVENL